jgi:hypothetical protein
MELYLSFWTVCAFSGMFSSAVSFGMQYGNPLAFWLAFWSKKLGGKSNSIGEDAFYDRIDTAHPAIKPLGGCIYCFHFWMQFAWIWAVPGGVEMKVAYLFVTYIFVKNLNK